MRTKVPKTRHFIADGMRTPADVSYFVMSDFWVHTPKRRNRDHKASVVVCYSHLREDLLKDDGGLELGLSYLCLNCELPIWDMIFVRGIACLKFRRGSVQDLRESTIQEVW